MSAVQSGLFDNLNLRTALFDRLASRVKAVTLTASLGRNQTAQFSLGSRIEGNRFIVESRVMVNRGSFDQSKVSQELGKRLLKLYMKVFIESVTEVSGYYRGISDPVNYGVSFHINKGLFQVYKDKKGHVKDYFVRAALAISKGISAGEPSQCFMLDLEDGSGPDRGQITIRSFDLTARQISIARRFWGKASGNQARKADAMSWIKSWIDTFGIKQTEFDPECYHIVFVKK